MNLKKSYSLECRIKKLLSIFHIYDYVVRIKNLIEDFSSQLKQTYFSEIFAKSTTLCRNRHKCDIMAILCQNDLLVSKLIFLGQNRSFRAKMNIFVSKSMFKISLIWKLTLLWHNNIFVSKWYVCAKIYIFVSKSIFSCQNGRFCV